MFYKCFYEVSILFAKVYCHVTWVLCWPKLMKNAIGKFYIS